MTCTDATARQALDELFVGELGAEAHQALRSHAATCDVCRAEYDKVTRVQARLEGVKAGDLAPSRAALLEQQLLQRVAASAAQAPARVPVAEPRESLWARVRLWMLPAGGLVAAGLALVLLAPGAGPTPTSDDGYQARGSDPRLASTFGVRAFCVERDGTSAGRVKAEAGPGETLSCAPGSAVQFAYTAPTDARLSIVAPPASGGEPLEFLAAKDPQAQVRSGTDVSLPFSTPVSGDWLRAPVEVKARFEDPQTGKVLGETTVRLTP